MTATTAPLLAALEKAGLPFLAGEPLARHTTLGVGGPVPAFLLPRDAAEVGRCLEVLGDLAFPYRVLGAGSNVLALDEGLDFAVITTERLASTAPPPANATRVAAGAGVFLPRLVRETASPASPGSSSRSASRAASVARCG